VEASRKIGETSVLRKLLLQQYAVFAILSNFAETRRIGKRHKIELGDVVLSYCTVATGSGTAAAGDSATTASQSQPSLMQLLTAPNFPRFSTIKEAPHFGQGSAVGRCGVVKSHSGYLLQP
jgi:hypothetical protein